MPLFLWHDPSSRRPRRTAARCVGHPHARRALWHVGGEHLGKGIKICLEPLPRARAHHAADDGRPTSPHEVPGHDDPRPRRGRSWASLALGGRTRNLRSLLVAAVGRRRVGERVLHDRHERVAKGHSRSGGPHVDDALAAGKTLEVLLLDRVVLRHDARLLAHVRDRPHARAPFARPLADGDVRATHALHERAREGRSLREEQPDERPHAPRVTPVHELAAAQQRRRLSFGPAL
mmetsp:Transcript_40014/g.99531  ORF Transcript_40014/g.99531 Transcript_40014/m.99531 type:complete len:234 (-) Transcript_40014:447-1148(-)